MINLDEILSEQIPKLEQSPKIKKGLSAFCKKVLREDQINRFLSDNEHLGAIEFLDQVMHTLGLSYHVSNWETENIPSDGRVIIVSNHPLGSLDGIVLLKLVSQIRSDIKIVANRLLNYLDPLQDFFLSVNNMSNSVSKSQYRAIEQALNQEQAVIFFPSGEVSRFQLNGIRDPYWKSGFLKMAKKTHSPVVPIYVGGKNSTFFYGLSLISKPASTLLLIKEMFRKAKVNLPIKIGEAIPYRVIEKLPPNDKVIAQLFKKHVYALVNDNKKPVFQTEKAIAHPQPRKNLKTELEQCELLTTTNDGKQIFLLKQGKNTALISEIGRLREISFRAVGEGSGMRIDIDKYDADYEHIILWDEEMLDIVGAYRVAPTANVTDQNLYSHTLFEYQKSFLPIKQTGLELGRSFVQPKYWGRRSLDYLWYGIGAYLAKNPQIQYLFGPVSISADFNKELTDWLIFYYSKYFAAKHVYAKARQAFEINQNNQQLLTEAFNNLDAKQGFRLLKNQLNIFNKTVPTLFKQYSELCHPGGVSFAGFNIDPLFNYCVDGLVIVEVAQLLDKKREKYIGYSC